MTRSEESTSYADTDPATPAVPDMFIIENTIKRRA
jgi:hypothetical protein